MRKVYKEPLFPELGQVGIVVRDLEKTVRYYTEALGLGPFRFALDRTIPDTTYRGKSSSLRLKQAWTLVGSVELELIEVLGGEGTHTEFLRDHKEGLHHLGLFVADLETSLGQAKERGIEPLHFGKIEGGGFAYLNTQEPGGVIFEFVQRRSFLEAGEGLRGC
jgi:catechol 2,3-dioxygenase-like lactoylglutathione lyase family enzyme